MLFSSGEESERLVSAGVMPSVELSVRSLGVGDSDMCTDLEISEENKIQNIHACIYKLKSLPTNARW